MLKQYPENFHAEVGGVMIIPMHDDPYLMY